MACDSRWSYETDEFLYYIDDSGYEKIVFTEKMVAIFAGKANVIEHFKEWINNGLSGNMPNPNSISIIAYNIADNKYFTRNHRFAYPSDKTPKHYFQALVLLILCEVGKSIRIVLNLFRMLA